MHSYSEHTIRALRAEGLCQNSPCWRVHRGKSRWRCISNHRATIGASTGSHLDDAIGGCNGVQVVLCHDDGIATLHNAPKLGDKQRSVSGV